LYNKNIESQVRTTIATNKAAAIQFYFFLIFLSPPLIFLITGAHDERGKQGGG
jgi:hypothetical protein